MTFEDFIAENKVKKTVVDTEKIKALVSNSEAYLESLSRIKIDKINSSLIASSYYESLRMIIEAIALKYGYNVYSHEAFTTFIYEILQEDLISKKFDRLRKIRNRINIFVICPFGK